MMFIFLLISLAIVGFVALAAQHRTVRIFAAFYYLVRPVADRRGFGAGHRAATVPDQIYQCRYRLLDEKVVHDIQPAGECETRCDSLFPVSRISPGDARLPA